LVAEPFGGWLKRLRQAAGLTQEELAEKAGISGRTVSDAERGLRTSVYADTARRLSSALGLVDSDRHAFERVARGRTPIDAEQPQLSPLPAAPTVMLGREDELSEVAAKLRDPAVLLLTLTGPGGIGKTRLAIEAASRSRDDFAGGVFFVSLAEVSEPSLIAPAVARALGVLETGPELEKLIVRRLSGRQVLLVLDTFEHILGAGTFVYSLMLALPNATFLVTSRSALRLRGEHEFAVPPIDRATAVELFIARARAIRAGATGEESSRLIAEICDRLDGIPLAIELAAARVRHLPLTALRDQLDSRLQLLTGGPVDLPRRQRTMRDTVAWSHDLLSESEAVLFRRLAVFSGGYDLDAVAAVCGPQPENEALVGISDLLDRNLISLSADDQTSTPRYRMFDVVREYAAERLAAARESEILSRRHADHFLALAEEAEGHLTGAGQDTWFRRLNGERGNLRRALAWALDRNETVTALRFTSALWRFWRHAGEFAEGRRWSDAALALAGDVPDSLRARALWGTAFIAFPQGDYARMAELAAEDLEVANRSGDAMDLRNALTISGQVAMCRGNFAQALAPFTQALEICRGLGHSWQLATSYMNLGNAVLHSGDAEIARGLFEEGLAVYRELGDVTFTARMMIWLAHVALEQGRIDEAEALAAGAVDALGGRGERLNMAEINEVMAAVAATRGDVERAASLAGEAAAIRQTVASRPAPYEQAIPFRLIKAAVPDLTRR
jgi:predicted ATPase/DNA-binding XRE family transcriptional regulator